MLKAIDRKTKRILAVLVALALVVTGLAIGLSGTLAAKPSIVESFARPNAYPLVEVGKTVDVSVTGARYASSSNTAIATVPAPVLGKPFTGPIPVTGIKAGIATISVGSSMGLVMGINHQVFDDNNINGYELKNNAEVYLKAAGDTAPATGADAYITVTPAGALGSITWRSMQPTIAAIASNGTITALEKGSAIILGTFTDTWGIERDLHILVLVGVKNGGSLNDLLEWVNKGQGILDLPDNPYTQGSLEDLDDAVSHGRDILNKEDPTEQEIQDAIQDIKDAIDALEKKPTRPGDILGPDSNGDYYRPVGDPPNVFEKVDEDGNSKQPPEYVYNPDGDPVGSEEKNKPAEKEDGKYWVEDPENIWKPVDRDGNLDDGKAIWGGPDGKPGGDNDKPAKEFSDGWWISRGQNVWQKYDPSKPRGPLGPLTGGGPDRDPSTDGVTDIYEHNDGRFFVGPMGDPGHEYYYGNPPGGGDGYLDSTANSLEGDDVVWYKDSNGNMTTTSPVGDGDPDVADDNGNGGRVLTPEQTGDTEDWIEIARCGAYSLIIRKSFINHYSQAANYGDPTWQMTSFGSNTNYTGSSAQTKINNWFKTTVTVSNGDNLPSGARLRNYTVQNDATTKLGKGSTVSGLTNAFSLPTTFLSGDGDNVAFALSYTEAANFCSITHDVRGANPEMQPSSAAAARNFNKLSGQNQNIWLRTPGDTTNSVNALSTKTGSNGRAFQELYTSQALIYPALWVKSTIFTDSVLPSVPGLGDTAIGGTIKIDNADWLIVRRKTIGSESFVYLLSKTSQGYGQNFDDTSSDYEGSKLQGRMTSKFSGSGFPTIKQIAVVPALGTHSDANATTEPTATLANAAGKTKDIFFAPSLKDAQNNRTVFNAVLLASPKRFWLRTSNTAVNVWDWLGGEDREASAHILGTNIDDMIGVWVKVA